MNAMFERRQGEALPCRIGQTLAPPQSIEDASRERISGSHPVDHRRDHRWIALPFISTRVNTSGYPVSVGADNFASRRG
ncbi:MAG: hypothetical protein Q8Q79_09335, partial [Sphingopyxis sp.]|nr:hypothetical protein [Sphingopyxis sp.]